MCESSIRLDRVQCLWIAKLPFTVGGVGWLPPMASGPVRKECPIYRRKMKVWHLIENAPMSVRQPNSSCAVETAHLYCAEMAFSPPTPSSSSSSSAYSTSLAFDRQQAWRFPRLMSPCIRYNAWYSSWTNAAAYSDWNCSYSQSFRSKVRCRMVRRIAEACEGWRVEQRQIAIWQEW